MNTNFLFDFNLLKERINQYENINCQILLTACSRTLYFAQFSVGLSL